MENQSIGPKHISTKVNQKSEEQEVIPFQESTKHNIQIGIIRQGSIPFQMPQKIDSQTNSIPNNSPRTIKLQTQSQNVTKQDFLRPPLHKLEWIAELCALTILAYIWAHFIIEFNKLPQMVEVSFDIDGTVDKVNKNNFAVLLLTITVAYLLMSFLQMIPHKFKYLVEVTAETAQEIFQTTRIYILYYKICTLIMFLYATIALFHIVEESWHPLTLYVVAVVVIFYFAGAYVYYKRLIRISLNPFA